MSCTLKGKALLVSHSSSVSGTVFTTTCAVANAFINAWASLIRTSAKARLLFAAIASEKAERKVTMHVLCFYIYIFFNFCVSSAG
jgi:hypothetical protein